MSLGAEGLTVADAVIKPMLQRELVRLEDLITGCPDDQPGAVQWQCLLVNARDEAADRRRGLPPAPAHASEAVAAAEDSDGAESTLAPDTPPSVLAILHCVAAAAALPDEEDDDAEEDAEEAMTVDLITTLAEELDDALTLSVHVHFNEEPKVSSRRWGRGSTSGAVHLTCPPPAYRRSSRLPAYVPAR